MTEAVVADRRVHPGTIGLRFLKDLPQSLIGLPAIFALISDTGWTYVLLIALAAAIILVITQWLSWSRFSYGVGAHEIVIKSGILSRNRRSIPFDRVQDVDIERGPLHRLFGLAKVRIETGGSAKDEGVLDSVTLAEADRLRAAIRAGKVREAAPDAAAAAEPDAHLLFAMSPQRVLVSGLFNFSMIYLAGLFAILQTFEPYIPFDIYDPGRWIGLVDETAVRGYTIGAWIAVLMVALVLGVITGVLRTLSRDFGFRLLKEGARLRRERGLFTRSEVVLPMKRVQLALVRSGPIRRAFGFGDLLFQTLGANKGGSGQQSVAPLARDDEMARILADARRPPMPDPKRLQRVSSRHIVRAAIRDALLPSLLILGLSAVRVEALLLLGVLPFLLVGAFLRRRFHRYELAGDTLFVQDGFWRRQLWMTPLRNAQAVRLSRSILQRWLGLATLSIDTAGAPVLGGPRIVDLKLDQARALMNDIAAGVRTFSLAA